MKAFRYIVASIICVDIGNVMIKYGLEANTMDFNNIISSYISMFLNPIILFGFIILALSSVFWLTALSRADLSYAYPMVSLGYVVIAIMSLIILKENITWIRWLGIFTICSGVFLMSKTGGKK